jgi:sarcosine oxidase, subunit gamma
MVESWLSVRRQAPVEMVQPGCPIGLCEPACRFSVRVRADVASVGKVAGLRLDMRVGRWTGRAGHFAARLGPDEWMFVGAEADAEKMVFEIDLALAGHSSAVVDISHRQAAFEVSGAHAENILNAGCPLDLHPSVTLPGFASRTLLGKAEIVLLRMEDPAVFRVECWRSFSTYVHGFLLEAARNCSARI